MPSMRSPVNSVRWVGTLPNIIKKDRVNRFPVAFLDGRRQGSLPSRLGCEVGVLHASVVCGWTDQTFGQMCIKVVS